MGPALAAVGAVLAALFEITIASRLQLAGAQLQILLDFAVVLAITVGFDEAMAWAFVGGLTVDLLAGRPLGSTALSLVVSAGIAAVLGRVLVRSRILGPVVAAFVLNAFYSVLLYMVTNVVHGPAAAPQWRDVAAAATINALFAGLIALPFAWWHRRSQERLKVVW